MLPDVLRLLRRLAADKTLPRGVRIRLGLLLAYLAIPIDLIPDFIPVLGYADDAIIVTAVLRSVVRLAGIDAVRRHWPGTDDGFTAAHPAHWPEPPDPVTELVFTVLAASVTPFGLPLLSSPRLRPAIAQTPTWSAGDGSEEGEHVQDHECERVDLQAPSEPAAERVGAEGEFAMVRRIRGRVNGEQNGRVINAARTKASAPSRSR